MCLDFLDPGVSIAVAPMNEIMNTTYIYIYIYIYMCVVNHMFAVWLACARIIRKIMRMMLPVTCILLDNYDVHV